MGMSTKIYGCIIEFGLWNGDEQEKIYAHNSKVLLELPEFDEWPPLDQNMLNITEPYPKDRGPNYGYCGRLIHFGGNFKSIEHEWKEWKEKFESLLEKLYWLEAQVHVQTEYLELQTYTWYNSPPKGSEPHLSLTARSSWKITGGISLGNPE